MSYKVYKFKSWLKTNLKKSPLVRQLRGIPIEEPRSNRPVMSDHSPKTGWEQALDVSMNIEGMLSREDAAAMVSILELQSKNEVSGGLAEFGTFKGRTAALLASYTRPDEPLYLVDVAQYLQQDKIAAINPNFNFVQCDSAKFIETALVAAKNPHQFVQKNGKKSFRFIHADGSHTFQNVFNDLKVADQLLAADGVVVMDDYFNPHYPQVAAAIYNYLSTQRTDLRVFLVGGNKCMLCRKEKHQKMMRFALNDFPELMMKFSQPVQISKTDRDKFFDCYSYKHRNIENGDDEHYGAKLYHQYY